MPVKYSVGDEDTRPWGHWVVLDLGEAYITKRITVNPDTRLSLQYHHHREEIWICVGGKGVATIGDDELPLSVGQIVHVPRTAPHRLTNNNDAPLVIVEVQLGETLDENDIVRLEDDFGRR